MIGVFLLPLLNKYTPNKLPPIHGISFRLGGITDPSAWGAYSPTRTLPARQKRRPR